MDHYTDIHLKPDPEFTTNTLMSALCSKLHRVLAKRKEFGIGVSFPDHALKPKRTVGDRMRLHGSEASLTGLMDTAWLAGVRDHVDVSKVLPVPADAQFRIVRRRQFKTNVERLRRRRAKRHGESLEQARAHIPDSVERRKIDLPSVTLRSESTGQPFSMFIEHGPLQAKAISGSFNTYGLSQQATIPWF